jgi:hypothetical protein
MLAAFEGLLCDFGVFDLTDRKTLGKKTQMYSNDHSFGSLNSIEWVENLKTLVVTDSLAGKVMIWRYDERCKWNKVKEIEKDGIMI